MLEAREEAPQLQSDSGARKRSSEATDRQGLRPTGCEEEPRTLERSDVRLHQMQALVRRLFQFGHARMELSHLLREALLTFKRTVDQLVRIINALIQALDGRQHIAHGSAAVVRGCGLFPWSHDTLIMTRDQELSKG